MIDLLNHTHDADMPLFASEREQRVVFFLVAMGIIALTYALLFAVDFLPEKPNTNMAVAEATIETDTTTAQPNSAALESENATTEVTSAVSAPIDPYPTRIIFDTLGREVAVVNPEANTVSALDAALLTGVVRHPDSADFERTGTIFLFGHSSYLPNVMNKNFQAFNGIQKLAWGDVIRLRSSDTEYEYRVDRVYQAAATDAEVKIETGKPKLTLVTCNSFGAKDDRFIVEATLVSERPLTG